jgi:hypothetical protein
MVKKVLIALLVLGVGVAIGKFATPSKVVEKEVIKYVDKIVEKKVYVKDTTKKNNKVTVRFVKILPDGTKTIETKTYDNSVIEITQNGTIDTNKETTLDKSTEKVVEYKKNDWMVSLGVKTDLGFVPAYGITVDRRIIGPFYLGAFAFTDQSFGLKVGISF